MYEQFINYITAVGKISEYACSQQDEAHVPVLYSGFSPLTHLSRKNGIFSSFFPRKADNIVEFPPFYRQITPT